MIKFRCLECSMKDLSIEVLSCPVCGGIRFVGEYYNESTAESHLQPSDFIYESIESNSEEKNQFVDNCFMLHDQKDSTPEGFDFSHNNSNQSERTYFESHGIVNVGSTYACNQNFPLIDEPSENFCPNFVGHECEKTTIESHGIVNEGSTFECNQNFPLIEEPSEILSPNFVGHECEKTIIESHGITNAGSTFECNQNFPLIEESSENFCPITIGKETIRPETENSSTIQTYSLNRQVNDNCFSTSSSFLWKPVCVSTAERQDLINVPHDLQRTECESWPSIEMRTNIQTIEESSRTQDIDDKLSSADSSHFEPQEIMLQSSAESLIAQNRLLNAREEDSSSLDLLSKTRSSSSQNSQFEDLKSMNEALQQKNQSSEKETEAGNLESGASNYYSWSTSKEVFRCQKCSRFFKSKSVLNVHEQNNCDPKPFKCDKCPMEFRYEAYLIQHHPVHTKEEPFKCNICCFATKWENYLKIHKLKMHKN